MNIAVGFACLVAVTVTAGATGLPEQQLAVGEQLDDYDDDLLERKGPGGCGTRMFCGIAGGRCQPKDDECDGELRTNKFYCKGGKKCGCCIPRGPPDCVFGDKAYPNGGIIIDSCMELQCIEGVWNYTGNIDKECGECQLFGDPHIFTYDNHTSLHSDYNGGPGIPHYYNNNESGIFIVTQVGLDIPAEYGLSAYMEVCYETETCVRGINYFEPGFELNITLPTFHDDSTCYDYDVDYDGDVPPGCEPKIYVNGEERTFDKSMESFYATDGTVLLFPHNHYGNGDQDYDDYWKDQDTLCMNIVGSKGLSMSFCMSTYLYYSNLYVWASPSLNSTLYGMCDTYTNELRDGYTLQNGSVTNDTELFVSTWKTWENENSGTELPNVDKCTNATVLGEIETKCDEITEGVCAVSEPWQCAGFITACVYDLCRSSNYNLQAQAYANHFLIHSHLAQ